MFTFAMIAINFLVVVLLYVTYISYYQLTYWKRLKVPHLKPVPIFGNSLPFFWQKVTLTDFLQNVYNKFSYARYCGYFDLTRPVMFLRDPDLVRDICIKNFDNFTDHDQFISEEADPVAGRNLFLLKGQRWKEMRNIMSPSFTAVRMKFMLKLIDEGARDFVQYWIDHPEETKCLELKELVSRFTTDIIATVAFGIKINSMEDRDNEFYRHAKAASNFSSLLILFKFIFFQRLPRLMYLTGITFMPKTTDRFLKKLVKETVRARQEQGIVRPDMVHILMQAMNKQNGVSVTIDDIMGQSFVFLLAGYDSTSNIICLLIHEVAANPEIQKKLIEEIDDQLEHTNGEVTYDCLSKMKYLDAVLNETLRMHPVTPFLNRLCVKDYLFPPAYEGGPEFLMKKGGLVAIPVYSLHRDPKYFPDPDKFIPERFSDGNKNDINQYAYAPFGLGPRKCIGDRFVIMETKALIVHLLTKFVVKCNEKTQHPIVYGRESFTLTAKDGFWVTLEPRKKID